MLGKKLRCPKCKEVFRANVEAQPTSDQPDSSGFASFDFDEPSPANIDAWPDADTPLTTPPIWSAPVREVPVGPKAKPALSQEQAARLQSRREYSLLMVGGSVCAVIALVVIVLGTMRVTIHQEECGGNGGG